WSTFFFKVTASTEIYTLSLHDALPIWAMAKRSASSSTSSWSLRKCDVNWPGGPRRCDTIAGLALKGGNATFSAPKSLITILFDKDRKSTRLNSSHLVISYAVFCLKKKK